METVVLQQVQKEEFVEFLYEVDSLFPIPLSQKTNIQQLAEKLLEKGTVLAIIEKEKIVGAVGMYANDVVTKTAYMSVLAVVPAFSSKGIATKIITDAFYHARNAGMEKVYLYTHKTNAGAIALYKKLGFNAQEDPCRPEDILFERKL